MAWNAACCSASDPLGRRRLTMGSARSGARCATICSAARRSAATLDFSAASMPRITSSPPKRVERLERADAHGLGRLFIGAPSPPACGAASRSCRLPMASSAASCTASGRLAQHLGQHGGQRIGGRLAIARGQRAIDADDAVALRRLAPEAELQQRLGAHAVRWRALRVAYCASALRVGGGAQAVVRIDRALHERLRRRPARRRVSRRAPGRRLRSARR